MQGPSGGMGPPACPAEAAMEPTEAMASNVAAATRETEECTISLARFDLIGS
jgi:hypothetical protein